MIGVSQKFIMFPVSAQTESSQWQSNYQPYNDELTFLQG